MRQLHTAASRSRTVAATENRRSPDPDSAKALILIMSDSAPSTDFLQSTGIPPVDEVFADHRRTGDRSPYPDSSYNPSSAY
jgi:hypothetical protein